MKLLLLFLIAHLVFGCSSFDKSEVKHKKLKKISYVITPNLKDSRALDIVFSFKGDQSGQTRIKHTKIWAGNDYEKDFTAFKVLNAGATLNTRKGHPKDINKVIEHKPLEEVSVRYSVRSNVETADKNYKAMIRPEYFHMIGQSFLMVPENENSDEVYEISLEFKNFPKSYNLVNSFFAKKSKARFVSKIEEFLYGVFVGGDFRIKKMKIKGKPLFVAIRDKWEFKDGDLFKTIFNIVSYQRNFFNDHSFKQFLVTLIPNGRDCCSASGTGLTNSFATFLPSDMKLDKHLKFLLSHELFHTWNGQKIRRVEPEELVYWFSEGFTDYYSRPLLLRAGEMNIEEFVQDYNEVLYKYYTSGSINEPNKKILKDFWNNYEIEKLPYQRGNILARKWNAQIKTQSKGKNSLDKILFDFFNESKNKGTKVSKDSFVRIAKSYAKDGFAKDIERYIKNGETIVPGARDLGLCVQRVESVIGKFEHGYDSKKTYDKKNITGLKKSSNAYKAGLRNGDKLLDRKIHFPPIKKSWMEVRKKNGQIRKVYFLPVAGKKRKAYMFELDKKAYEADPAKCMKWFLN